MEREIQQQFQQQNLLLLKRKLKLDLDRNFSAILDTFQNIVDLETTNVFGTNTLQRFSEQIKQGVDFTEMAEALGLVVKEALAQTLQKKQAILDSAIEEMEDVDQGIDACNRLVIEHVPHCFCNVDQLVVQYYDEHLESEFRQFVTGLPNKQKKTLLEMVRNYFKGSYIDRLQKKIDMESQVRTQSLQNIFRESYDYYLDLQAKVGSYQENSSMKK